MKDKLLNTYSELVKTVKAPEYMAKNAKRGLEIRDNQPPSNKCCERTGLARANQLVNGENLSLSTLKRMKSFLSRHGSNVKSDIDLDSKLAQSIFLWGAYPSKKEIKRAIKWLDEKINSMEKE